MSEAAKVSDIVSMSIGGDSSEVKSAIGDVLQQKITVALENKKKDIAQTFLTKTEHRPERAGKFRGNNRWQLKHKY